MYLLLVSRVTLGENKNTKLEKFMLAKLLTRRATLLFLFKLKTAWYYL